MAASDTDLSPAIAKGAKFLFWHGWADPASTRSTPSTMSSREETARLRQADAIRLFLRPA